MKIPKFIRLDVYPARIVHNKKVIHPNTRIIVGDTDYYIFKETTRGPALEISGPIYDLERDFAAQHKLFLDEDTIYYISRLGGCGCGSTLKNYTPFFGVPYV